MKKIIFTTSWDDGHPLDLKLAFLLKKYNIKGTFYVSLKNRERPVMTRKSLITISKMGFEIGSHALTHQTLIKLNHSELLYEIKQSKKKLENITKKPVFSFCYPKGKYNSEIIKLLQKNDYLLGRTTKLFNSTLKFNPFLMPTTFHLSKRSSLSYLKQEVLELNLIGLYNWLLYFSLKKAIPAILYIIRQKRVSYIHLWGHSWEIEKYNLWHDLENFFAKINRQKDIIYLTNYEVIQYLNL